MTLLEYNKLKMDYLHSLQEAILGAYEGRITELDVPLELFTEEATNVILQTLSLLQDKVRMERKYYFLRNAMKEKK